MSDETFEQIVAEAETIPQDIVDEIRGVREDDFIVDDDSQLPEEIKNEVINGFASVKPTVYEEWKSTKHMLYGKKVLVTGGSGFLGKRVMAELEKFGAKPVCSHSREYNLNEYEQTRALFITYRPDFVIHCAGYNGGIEFNRLYPADILDQNIRMALNVHKASHEFGVQKVLSIITSCAYPDGADVLKEETLWDGLPNETIRGHGIAKRTLQVCAEQYHKQYGLDAVCTAVTNLYGPGDTFDLTRTKVVGAVIRKVVEAHQAGTDVEFWGTGAPLRQFMYVDDAAEAIVSALENYNEHDKPLNIGVNYEFTIRELVDTVVDAVGYEGNVTWDESKGDGQMRKMLDISHAEEVIEWSNTGFADGIRKTVEWYIANKDVADGRK